jgi:hypothetical protein
MAIVGRFTFERIVAAISCLEVRRSKKIVPVILLGFSIGVLSSGGCGQTATPVTSQATTQAQVDTYFGGPFNVAGSAGAFEMSSSAFDHSTNQVGVSSFTSTHVPAPIMNGTFTRADTGFLSISENFTTTSLGVVPENPPITGAWAVEIPGAGVLANFLNLRGSASGGASAAPVAMAENTACPNFTTKTPFLYVTVPKTSLSADTADYGAVNITVQGSAVTIDATPFLIGPVGPVAQAASTVTAGCSNTNLGALTAYPINSFGSPSSVDLISIGGSSFLISRFTNLGGGGAFGGGTGVIGVAEPSQPVDVSALVGAKYNGFIYAPLNAAAQQKYDITVLASSFGNHSATSQACSALQASLLANNGQGAKTIPVLPSANTLYGGEFLTTTGAGAVNDPSGASGSENCDVAIDLGIQDSATNGLFPKATVFIGSNYPPFSGSNPWTCSQTGSICAVSFPAAAVVGQLQGQYVIFLVASAASNPAPQFPGSTQNQPVGIYLFQRAQ